MFSVVVNTGNPSVSAFKAYTETNGWKCPAVADGNKLASVVGGGGGNYHAIIYPDKRYERVMSDIVSGLGFEKHVCGGTTEYKLIVNSGTGDGDHAEGVTVTIKADTAPTGKVFDKWTGDIQYLADQNNSTTTIIMPAQNIEVTATYKDVISDTYTLIVNSGSGGGEYEQNTSVSISANAAPTGKIFDKWIGDADYLADPNCSTTTITMPAQNIEVSAVYKDKGPLTKKDNYMVISSWEGAMDTLGSSINIDSSKKADTVLTSKISLGKSDETNKNWVWAQITGYADGDFSAVTSVEITYSSDAPVYVSLDQEGLADDGASHQYLLPADANGHVTLSLSDFAQPDWVATDSPELVADLDITKILSVSFAAVNEEATVNLELQGIYLEGFKNNTPIVNKENSFTNSSLRIASLTTGKLVVSGAPRGMYDISIFNVSGKKIVSDRHELSGNSIVDFKNGNLVNGAYIVKIKSNDVSVVSGQIIR